MKIDFSKNIIHSKFLDGRRVGKVEDAKCSTKSLKEPMESEVFTDTRFGQIFGRILELEKTVKIKRPNFRELNSQLLQELGENDEILRQAL